MMLLLTLLIQPVLMIWSGFVLSKLWFWFMVPTFGLPALSIPAAIGIAIVVRYLTLTIGDLEGDDPKKTFALKILKGVLSPAIALLTGWIVSLFL